MIARACRALLPVLLALWTCAPRPSAIASPCGLRATPPATYEHVVWIWFENHGYGEIVSSRAAPYIDRTLIHECGLATNYHALMHPSLPNYIAATSGLSGQALAPFSHDCNAVGPCLTDAPSLFAQVTSWGAYEESMPKPCLHFFHAPYSASHNPAAYYRVLSDCALHDVGLRHLQQDLAADHLPPFTFVMPNLCHSMHSCSVRTGDRWLRHVLSRLTSSPAYARGTMAIFVTFDESDPHSSDSRVPTVVVSPSTAPGTRSPAFFTHYSLLRTTEEMLGVDTLLGRANRARSMRAAFNL
jgi:phosphatidylinositol-3-phosphatase